MSSYFDCIIAGELYRRASLEDKASFKRSKLTRDQRDQLNKKRRF